MKDLPSPAEIAAPPFETDWSAADDTDLARAVEALERESFASRLSALIGRQIGLASSVIPDGVLWTANDAAAKALTYAMRAALSTMGGGRRPATERLHLAAVAASGAVGGAFGLATLPFELPVSTTLILRSIADIARHEGEDLSRPEAGLACLEVFALGAGHDPTHFGEGGYLATRTLLAKSISQAAKHIVGRGLVEDSAPAVIRLVGQIASRFGVVVSEKLVAQSVPLLGALSGAAINAAFLQHYQGLARAHFTVRRLERRYGPEAVEAAYTRLRAGTAPEPAAAAPDAVPDRRRRPLELRVVDGEKNG